MYNGEVMIKNYQEKVHLFNMLLQLIYIPFHDEVFITVIMLGTRNFFSISKHILSTPLIYHLGNLLEFNEKLQ